MAATADLVCNYVTHSSIGMSLLILLHSFASPWDACNVGIPGEYGFTEGDKDDRHLTTVGYSTKECLLQAGQTSCGACTEKEQL